MKDAEWFINNWRNVGRFSAPVNVMFKLCQETYPKNNNLEEVLLKCAAINAFSSTNVYDLYSMANHIVGKQIDERLKNNDLSLVKTISEVEIGGKKRNFYSFATKYCHYHNPENYPIYDKYVAKILCSYPEDFQTIKDKELREYEKFVGALKDFRQHYGLNLSFIDLDKYLWRLGRWYFNPYEPTLKYYHREDENPFPPDDIRNKFWHGEMMFSNLDNQEKVLREYKKSVSEWKVWLNEHKQNQAARFLKENTTEQLCVAMYITLLWGKWCPNDEQEWIFEY
jgi:hypothetical protein